MAFGEQRPLWEASPRRKEGSAMAAFAAYAAQQTGLDLSAWPALYQWSCNDIATFWLLLSKFVGTKWQQPPSVTWDPPAAGRMLGGRWFGDGALNFAENTLPPADQRPVLIARYEGGARHILTGEDLQQRVAACATALRHQGVGPGSYVAGVIHNGWEAIVAMLATAAVGAVWSSCSPDFGVQGIVDRLGQLNPEVLFFSLGYHYNGSYHDCRPTLHEVSQHLGPQVCVVGVPYPGATQDVGTGIWQVWDDFMGAVSRPTIGLLARGDFAPTPFDHPLFVMFSSGTTGVPKAIVHGVGGTFLQHQKELRLHTDLGSRDRFLFYTTCGWMMWNWMASALASGCCVVTYDGSPAYPQADALWQLAAEEELSVIGTSPKYIAACLGKGLQPAMHHRFDKLRTVLTTGSPLLPEHFHWVYRDLKADVHLASISGGTDIISCFMLGNPLLPVYEGEIQGAGLGMAIAAYNQQGEAVVNAKGELVCTKPFVSMPLGFLNDPDQSRYRKTYFSYYGDRNEGDRDEGDAGTRRGPEVWRHGDYVAFTPHGGVIVYGRSDATLNPGGVRIGTSEIYRQVETMPEIEDSIAVGRQIPGDCEVVLFVKLRSGLSLDAALQQKIRAKIRQALTVRHVPARIIAVSDIPYTRSGKKVELAVAQAIHGEKAANVGALANPEALAEYEALRFQ